MTGIPCISVSGDARARGLAQGEQLKDRIHQTVEFYKENMFKHSPLSPTEIQQSSTQINALIYQFNPDFCTEIEAIAEASGLPVWELYALNARTEILNTPVTECTSLFFRDSRLLGQTWDWCQELEELVVLVEHEYQDGRCLLTLTEPGMLAKIGLNDRGVGLCINILLSQHSLDGVPVHIVTRAVLESNSVQHAKETIKSSGMGKSSHFLVADDTSDSLSVEFSGGQCTEVAIPDDVYLHTNHCLASELSSDVILSSRERFRQGETMLKNMSEYTSDNMKKILLEDSGGALSIQCPYNPVEEANGAMIGTCATVVMDLPGRTLQIKKGPNEEATFFEYTLR